MDQTREFWDRVAADWQIQVRDGAQLEKCRSRPYSVAFKLVKIRKASQ